MSDINWDLAPEGAVELIQDSYEIYWGNAKGEWFDTDDMTWNKPLSKNHVTIATRPQPERKTVEDAVEWVSNGHEICSRSFTQNNMLSFCKDNNTYAFVSETSIAGSGETENWQPICTREEFEACVAAKGKSEPKYPPLTKSLIDEAEQDGEPEWTHSLGGRKCKIALNKPDVDDDIVVLCEGGDYQLVGYDQLKPLKPTITKAEAWDKLTKLNSKYQNMDTMTAIMTLCDEHDITD